MNPSRPNRRSQPSDGPPKQFLPPGQLEARRQRRAFLVSEIAMAENASELARRLAGHAEAVCRHYLSNGRREGRYWLVGDARNTPGRSLFVYGAEAARAPPAEDRRRHRRTWRSARHHPQILRPD